MEKPTLPKGTRDFGPAVMVKRQFILEAIKKVFQKFGFQPLETPAMENLSTLTGKYGDEGDQLLFRVLDSGDFFSDSSIIGAKASHYLIQSLRYVTYELFCTEFTERYKSVIYLTQEDSADSNILFEWLKKYYSTNILKGRMVETVDYNIDFLINSQREYENVLKEISEFLSPFFKYNLIGRSYKSKEEIDHYLDYQIIQNYEKLYQIIGKFSSDLRSIRNSVAEKGLRYDLTVPFARYVVMNRHEIAFPFKRYQVQPVWRADRPQKGRYREFYQCDADVVGTNSLICEAEIILMIKEVMSNLGVNDFAIKINHRGVLAGLAEKMVPEKQNDLFVAIDKLEKIGEQKVREELLAKGFTERNLDFLFEMLSIKELDKLGEKFERSEVGTKGVNDLTEVFEILKSFGATQNNVELDVSLARGLSYYTGCIFEVKINNVGIGSVSGGGRYDNLTAAFGDKENLSGVGFSFGVDRLYDALEELNLFPKEAQLSSKILICHFDEETMKFGLKALAAFRKAGIASEIYPDQSKLKKQLDFANKKLIPFTIVIGTDEMQSGALSFKNMESGEQEKLTIEQIIQKLK